MSGINPDSHPDHRGDDDLPQGLFVDGTLSFPERIIPTVSVETINVFFQQLNANPGLVKSHSNELLSTQPHLFHALSLLAVHLGLDSEPLWLNQVHGVDLFTLHEGEAPIEPPSADAAMSRSTGRRSVSTFSSVICSMSRRRSSACAVSVLPRQEWWCLPTTICQCIV